jgi:prevent-host-death family protein
MQTMSISKFKATCLAVLERVRRTGEPVQVTKFGKPIAEVVAVPETGKRLLGYMRGTLVGPSETLADLASTDSGWDENETSREWDELNAKATNRTGRVRKQK